MMTMEQSRTMALIGLAHRRYPDLPLPLALHAFESDRHRAGLGALDMRYRSPGGRAIQRFKFTEFRDGEWFVEWVMRVNLPPEKRFRPKAFLSNLENYEGAVVELERLERVVAARCVRLTLFFFNRNRDTAAQVLRAARREMRAEIQRQRGGG